MHGPHPVNGYEVQVEAFFLKNGVTNPDLQTIRRSFNPTKVDKVEQTVKITLGAGTYNGKGVNSFTILEARHAGAMKGKIAWAGATTEITLKITIDKQGAVTFTGPWSNN